MFVYILLGVCNALVLCIEWYCNNNFFFDVFSVRYSAKVLVEMAAMDIVLFLIIVIAVQITD